MIDPYEEAAVVRYAKQMGKYRKYRLGITKTNNRHLKVEFAT